MTKTRLQAHRGVSSEYPENTIAAFRAAVDEGYDIIELDTKFTSDSKCVVLHDRTLNRTGRTATGESLPDNTAIADITLDFARSLDFGIWKNEKFKGEKISTLGETVEFIRSQSLPFKFDNVWETFTEEQQEIFLGELQAADLGSKIGFTCRRLDCLEKAAARFPAAELHWDGSSDDETLGKVAGIAKNHRLTVWLCFDNDKANWYKGPRATPALVEHVKLFGEVGVWILSEESELVNAVRELHADAVETTGKIKPFMLKNL